MRFDEFFNEVRERELEIEFDRLSDLPPTRLSNEAIFHLPLLAITILMLTKGHSKPVVEVLGQLVGECLERTFVGFRGSAQHLGWSATLRVRTVQALSFLEVAKLVYVEPRTRQISATDLGRSVIGKALADDSDLQSTLQVIHRSYRNIRAEKQHSLDLQ